MRSVEFTGRTFLRLGLVALGVGAFAFALTHQTVAAEKAGAKNAVKVEGKVKATTNTRSTSTRPVVTTKTGSNTLAVTPADATRSKMAIVNAARQDMATASETQPSAEVLALKHARAAKRPDGPQEGPGGDDCVTAAPVTEGSFPFDNAGDTLDATAPVPCEANMTDDIWFVYTAGCTGTATIGSGCNDAVEPDTTLEVFDGGACPPVTSLACSDDACGTGSGFASQVSIAVTSGNQYLVRIGGWNSGAAAGTLDIACDGTVGGNDDCSNAIVALDGSTPFDTSGATGAASACDSNLSNDIWFVYSATCDGTATVAAGCADAVEPDTVLEVFDGGDCATAPSIGCADDTCGTGSGFASSMSFAATGGNSYLIRLSGWNGGAASGTMDISCSGGAPACPVNCPAACDADGACCVTQNCVKADDGTHVACGAAGVGTTENGYARCFGPGAGDVPAGDYVIDSVKWGVSTFTDTAGLGTIPINVNVYTVASCPPGLFADAALVASEATTVSVADNGTFRITPLTTPPTIAAGTSVLVEIEAPLDGTIAGGEYDLRLSASGTACGDAYLRAASCGIVDWAGVTGIGFPGSQYLVTVNAHEVTGTAAVCGDSILNGCEQCDPPDGTTCDANCQFLPCDKDNDTCATAFPITSLPFKNLGNTCGTCADDYAEICPDAASSPGSSDVVYVYTPATDDILNILTCQDGAPTDYDTQLYVYESVGVADPGVCGTTAFVGCNEDGCSTPTQGFLSSIVGMPVTAGNTYYIVVDGWGGACGNYDLHVESAIVPPVKDDLNTNLFVDVELDGIGREIVHLVGSTSVLRDAGPYAPGQVIGTEMVSLAHSVDPMDPPAILPDMNIALRTDVSSTGEILVNTVDVAGDLTAGDSFFDVFHELTVNTVPPIVASTNQKPIHVTAAITGLPPFGASYVWPNTDPNPSQFKNNPAIPINTSGTTPCVLDTDCAPEETCQPIADPLATAAGVAPGSYCAIRDEIIIPNSGTITDLDVDMIVSHTWRNDLVIVVEHKNIPGAGVALAIRPDGADDNIGNPGTGEKALFSDDGVDGPFGAVAGDNPVGTFVPDGLALAVDAGLATFNGQDKQGTWSITAWDFAFGDGGSLDNWGLHFQTQDAIPTIPLFAQVTAPCGLTKDYPIDAMALPIPDADPVGVSHSFMVPDAGPVFDLDVDLDISHTWVGDLCVTLEHLGTTVTLIQRPGDSTGLACDAAGCCGENSDNYAGIILDDEGTGGAINDQAGFTGLTSPPNYTPENPLSAFDGMEKSGLWTLTVVDNVTGDTGTLNSWSLHMCNEDNPTVEMEVGRIYSVTHDVKTPMCDKGNDTCATAVVVPGPFGIMDPPYKNLGNNCECVDDYNEVCPYTNTGGRDSTYVYTPAANEIIDISLCQDADGDGTPDAITNFDTKLYVYESVGAADPAVCGTTANVACNDDACATPFASFVSEITGLALTAGNTYYIVVDAFDGAECGDYDLHIAPTPPPCDKDNDTCATAFDINVAGGLPFKNLGNTCFCTDDYNEVCPYANTGGQDSVYVYTPAANEFVTINTCQTGAITNFDTKLYVYENICPDAGNAFACNDDACTTAGTGFASEIADLLLSGGNTYYIVVDAFDGAACGDYDLHIESAPAGACCDGAGGCTITTQANCPVGSTYLGDGTKCLGDKSYNVAACANPLEDISATGTLATLASSQDDDGDVVPIGFTFNYWNDDHDMVGVASNGYLTFGTDLSDFSNDPIPTATDPNDLIAPFWDDWSPNLADFVSDVHYETLGTAPNRRFIAQWTDVPPFGSVLGDPTATFQAVLEEGTNCIEFHYGTLVQVSPTVGLENQDGTLGTDGGSVLQGDCLRFCPKPPLDPCAAIDCNTQPMGFCDDGLDCTVDVCNMDGTCSNTPVDCDDLNECTADSCVEPGGTCLNDPAPLNGMPCAAGAGTCNNGVCDTGPGPCTDDLSCDDLDLCTIEFCCQPTDQTDDGSTCVLSECVAKSMSGYGDVNNDAFTSADDVNCLLDDVGGNPTSLACCDRLAGTCSGAADTLPAADFQKKDLAPCPSPGDPNNMGDGFKSADDVNAILDTISGSVPNANVGATCLACTSPAATAPTKRWDLSVPAVDEASLLLVPSKRSVNAGDVIAVEVYVTPVENMRTFQVTLDAVGGEAGSLAIDSIEMDAQRRDFVFNGLETVGTTGVVNHVMLSTLPIGGVEVVEQAYLGTFNLRVSDDAAGTFVVRLRMDGSTLLRTSESEVIAVDSAPVNIIVNNGGLGR